MKPEVSQQRLPQGDYVAAVEAQRLEIDDLWLIGNIPWTVPVWKSTI